MSFLSDALSGSGNGLACPGQVGLGRLEPRMGVFDGGLVSATPVPAAGFFCCRSCAGGFAGGVAEVVLVVAQVRPRAGEGVASVRWQAGGEALQVISERG